MSNRGRGRQRDAGSRIVRASSRSFRCTGCTKPITTATHLWLGEERRYHLDPYCLARAAPLGPKAEQLVANYFDPNVIHRPNKTKVRARRNSGYHTAAEQGVLPLVAGSRVP